MKRVLGILGVAVLAASAPFAASAHQSHTAMKYTVKLTGKAEVPVKGPSSGSGTAVITLNDKAGTVCYNITVKGIDLPAVADHIHAGKAGVAGPVSVLFTTAPAKNGKANGCIKHVKASLIKAMEKHPSKYYVNVHTKKYAGGAVRGQL